MKIWIDTTSGTWGEVLGDNGALMIVDLTKQAAADTAAGEPVDEYSLAAALESMDDSEIAEYGMKYGKVAT